MFRFEELEIWKLAITYGKDCYTIASKLPEYEKYGLADQLRRAGLSISNNIAEGSVGSSANFKKYLYTAIAPTLETVNILTFGVEVKYIDRGVRDKMYEEAEKLVRKLRSFMKVLT